MLGNKWVRISVVLGFTLVSSILSGCGSKAPPPLPGLAVSTQPGATYDGVLEVPFILWGGDVATFQANGGLETKPDSLFAKQGLKVKLTRKDDFEKQVSSYVKGESPFLRGTMSMLGQASDQLTKDPAQRPVVFLQLTWSAGDHVVSRATCKTLNDLKGKKIALQSGGPHVGMLDDVLRTVRLKWSDVNVVWTPDVTGDKGPAAAFRKDPTIDACFAISPDMTDLTGGLDKVGNGEKTTVKDAHVLVSTAQMSRSIADVYACRMDFYEKYRGSIEKFAAAYLKASEEMVQLRKKWDDDKKATDPKYAQVLQMTQEIYGKEDVKTVDDAHGLIMDASFVGLPGNISFFTDKGNLSGYMPKARAALALPADPAKEPAKPVADVESKFLRGNLDYERVRTMGGIAGYKIPEGGRIKPEKLDRKQTIFTFKITFEPDMTKFSEDRYGADFQRALEMASLFGNTGIAIYGHADPKLMIDRFVAAAKAKDVVSEKDGKLFLKDGTELRRGDVTKILEIINKEDLTFVGVENGRRSQVPLKSAVASLQELSDGRANAVLAAVVAYGARQGLTIDRSQIRPEGLGVTSPVVAYPLTDPDAEKNRRVEFSIIKVPSGDIREDDYNF